MTDPTMLDCALAYAAKGWPVFPCNWRQDKPGAKSRKSKSPMVPGADKDDAGRPVPKTGGVWRASTDDQQIRSWWWRNPKALIGVPMGSRTGVFVIDLDPRDGEDVAAVLRRLTDAVGPLPVGPRSMTQSGGMHLWFANPEGEELPRNSAKRIKGVDWRGEGGYVIAPPSVMDDGAAYSWITSPEEQPFPDPPATLLDLVYQRGAFARGKRGAGSAGAADGKALSGARNSYGDGAGDVAVRRYAQTALENAARDMARCPQGQRGHTLNEKAFVMGPFVTLGHLSEREVYAALQDAADTAGLTATDGARERDAKIARGLAAGAGNTGDLDQRLSEVRADAESRAARYAPGAGLRPAPHPTGEDRGDASRNAKAEAGASSQGGSGGDNSGSGGKNGSGARGGKGSGGKGGGKRYMTPPKPAVLEKLASEPQNDTGNAKRLIGHFGADIMNVRNVGQHIWVGTHWELEGGDEAMVRFAQATAARIGKEAIYIEHSKTERDIVEAAEPLMGKSRKDLSDAERAQLDVALELESELKKTRSKRRTFAVSSGNHNKIHGMLKQALPHITLPPDDLDADPLAINVLNGTIRMEKVVEADPDCPDPDANRTVTTWRPRLDKHDRADRIANVMPVEFDPDALCPKWDQFLAMCQPDDQVCNFLQTFHGYALTGLTGEQAFVFNYGLGANGKSTFMEAIARLMGAYAQVLPGESLTGDAQRRGDQATPEYARLVGARLVRCSELARGQSFRESALKVLTGGEAMLVRHLHEKFFELHPTFKAIGSGNDRPNIGGVDEGIWRRVKLVPWEETIPKDQRRDLEAVLAEFAAESAGILNWLLDGLIGYLTDGLKVPKRIAMATESYRNDMDPVGEFLSAHVKDAPGEHVTAREMFESYKIWCDWNSVKPFGERGFASVMQQKGVKKEMGRIRKYLDVRLDQVPEDPNADKQGTFGNG